MKFTSLGIENFMSVRSASTTLNDRGLVLVKGINEDAKAFDSNGAGKSTVFSESIVWCLFGETIRGHKGDDVVNKTAKKDTKVAIGVLDDNGDQYVITRYRKHKEHKNHVIITRNGNNITPKSDTDTTVLIEHLLGIDYRSFTNSILFGQGVSKMFASSTDSEQKAVLERMLQIEVFKDCQDEAKARLSQVSTEVDKLNAKIDSNQHAVGILQKSLIDLEKAEARRLDDMEKQVAKLESDRIGISEQLEMANVNLNNYDSERDGVKGLLDALLRRLESKAEPQQRHDNAVAEVNLHIKEITKLENQIKSSTNRLNDIRKGKNIPKFCDKCGQEIPLGDTSSIEKHLQDDIDSTRTELEGKQAEQQNAVSMLNQAKQELAKYESLDKKAQSIRDTLKDIDSDLRVTQQEIDQHEKAIQRIGKQIVEAQNKPSLQPTIDEYEEQIISLNASISDCQDQVCDKMLQKDLYTFWVNAYGNQGIKSVLLDSVTPFLNKRANHYLARLSDSSIQVTFNTQTTLKSGEKRDKFSVDIINTIGDDSYKGLSNGEKRRADLAINLALQDLVASRSNKHIDLIVYDEAFEGLDEVGCENLIGILQEKANTCGTILVITHNDILKDMFTKSVIVSKSGGKTIIREEIA